MYTHGGWVECRVNILNVRLKTLDEWGSVFFSLLISFADTVMCLAS